MLISPGLTAFTSEKIGLMAAALEIACAEKPNEPSEIIAKRIFFAAAAGATDIEALVDAGIGDD